MRSPTISVIMVARNAAQTVAQSVASVLAQTHQRFELLFVDDCSHDDTVKQVEAFADLRIQIIRNSSHRGQSYSRNYALSRASAEWVTMLDADDLMHPFRLMLNSFLARRANKPAIFGTWALQFGNHNGAITPPVTQAGIRARAFFSSPLVHSTLFSGRQLLSELSYSPQFELVADYDLCDRAISEGVRLQNSPLMSTKYRLHGNQVSALFPSKGQALMAVVHSRALRRLDVFPSKEDLRTHMALATNLSSAGKHISRRQVRDWSRRVLQAARRKNPKIYPSLLAEFARREHRLFSAR